MEFQKRIIIGTLSLIAWAAAHVQADEASLHPKFSDAIDSIAADVIKYIQSEPETEEAIRIGSWDGPGGGGSLISIKLREVLQEANITLKKVSGYSISGSYEQDQNSTGRHVTVITANIKNTSGNEVHVLRRRLVTDDKVAIRLFGVTVDNTAASDAEETEIAKKEGKVPNQTPLGSTKKSDAQLRDTIANPKQSTLDVSSSANAGPESVMRFAAGSPYGVELLVSQEDGSMAPCPIQVEDGTSFADIGVKQVYAIKIYNGSGKEVGVDISIDGVNIFAFSDNPTWKSLGKVLVRPGQGIIRGWSGKGTSVNKFTIVEYGESAAAELGLFQGVGSITVVFHPAHESKNATGRGEQLNHAFEPAHARFDENVLGSISVKYVREKPPTDLPPAG